MIAVRAEGGADVSAVDALVAEAFGRREEADLVAAMRYDAKPALSLVGVLEGEVAGHVFASPAAIEGLAASPPVAGVGPLAVQPRFQRRGVGSALMHAALEACEPLGWSAVFLLGNPAYYSRFGFELASPRGIRYKSEIYDAHFQVRELERGCLGGVTGAFVYHEAFDRVGGS